jgi:hypothetical protein
MAPRAGLGHYGRNSCFSLRNLPFGFLTQRIRSILILKGFVKRISLLKQVLLFWHETNA